MCLERASPPSDAPGRSQRTTGAARGGILENAERRREHARICVSRIGRSGAIGREDVGLEVEQRVSGTARSTAAAGRSGRRRTALRRTRAQPGSPVPRISSSWTPSARATDAMSSNCGPNSGNRCVIHAKLNPRSVPLERDRRRADVQSEDPIFAPGRSRRLVPARTCFPRPDGRPSAFRCLE